MVAVPPYGSRELPAPTGLRGGPPLILPPPGGLPDAPLALHTPEIRGVVTRLHRVEPGATPSGLGIFSGVRDNPAARAVLMGVGGLSLLTGAGVVTAQPVEAATTTNAQADRSIVFVGMNETSSHEVENLRSRVGHAGVTYIAPSKQADKITVRGTTYDLTTPEGRNGFVATLGLRGDKATALSAVIEETGDNARDELAQLVRVLSEAQRGQRVIDRLVLSGHSVGSGVWGDGNGSLSFETLSKVLMLFPNAASQVQDLLLAACYTGGEVKMDNYRALFPNVKTIWAYDGSSPGSVSGAVPHILRWERGTRGTRTDLNRKVAEGTRKGENIAVWTVTKGYDNGKPARTLEEDLQNLSYTNWVVPEFISGERAVENPQLGPLRDHYNAIQRLLARVDLPAEQRPDLEKQRDHVIRLLFYQNVTKFFQTTYQADIQAGFGELGLPAPDFSKLSRKDGLAKIAEYDTKLNATPTASSGAKALSTRLHAALVDLSPSAVPPAWI